jgi:hypothetical protein
MAETVVWRWRAGAGRVDLGTDRPDIAPALSLAFQLPPGKARPSRSLATADTDCLRWRASNHSRSWTSSVNRRLRALVSPAGAGRFRWARDGGDEDPL